MDGAAEVVCVPTRGSAAPSLTHFVSAATAFVVDIVVSVVVTQFTAPKPAHELKGLVYSETPKADLVDHDEKELAFWRRPVPMAGIALVLVIILNIGGRIMGMVVDSVSDVTTLSPDQIKPAPEMGSAFNSDYMIGLGTVDERMLILVDIDKLMSSGEMGLIEKLAALSVCSVMAPPSMLEGVEVPVIVSIADSRLPTVPVVGLML